MLPGNPSWGLYYKTLMTCNLWQMARFADRYAICMHIMCAVSGLNKRSRVRWAVSWLVGGEKTMPGFGHVRTHSSLHPSTPTYIRLNYFHHYKTCVSFQPCLHLRDLSLIWEAYSHGSRVTTYTLKGSI